MSPARVVRRTTGVLALAVLIPLFVLTPSVSLAQAPAQPPGPYVIDVRGTTLGVPQTSPFYPDIPPGTFIPARSFGVQGGAHVYPFSIGTRRIGVGVGVDLFLTRGTASTPRDEADSGSEDGANVPVPEPPRPDVDVRMRIVSPQLSINFGTAHGWSYLTTGVGVARVESSAGPESRTTSKTSFNAGAGARWFINSHLGVGFDVRALWLGSRAVFAASAGFSLK